MKSYLPFAQKLGLGLLLQRTQRTQNFEGDGESSTSDSYSFREATEVELPSYAMGLEFVPMCCSVFPGCKIDEGTIGQCPAAAHSSPKRLKPAENKFTQSYFTSFSIQVSANSHNFRFRSLRVLHIQKISNCCRHKYYCVNFTNF